MSFYRSAQHRRGGMTAFETSVGIERPIEEVFSTSPIRATSVLELGRAFVSLRVLRYMATNLLAPEIATELSVS